MTVLEAVLGPGRRESPTCLWTQSRRTKRCRLASPRGGIKWVGPKDAGGGGGGTRDVDHVHLVGSE